MDNSTIPEVLQILEDGLFVAPPHRAIFLAIRTVHREKRRADLGSVRDELDRTGYLDRAGGPERLKACLEATPSPKNALEYAIAIRDFYKSQRPWPKVD